MQRSPDSGGETPSSRAPELACRDTSKCKQALSCSRARHTALVVVQHGSGSSGSVGNAGASGNAGSSGNAGANGNTYNGSAGSAGSSGSSGNSGSNGSGGGSSGYYIYNRSSITLNASSGATLSGQ